MIMIDELFMSELIFFYEIYVNGKFMDSSIQQVFQKNNEKLVISLEHFLKSFRKKLDT